jgi:hypothetical protein
MKIIKPNSAQVLKFAAIAEDAVKKLNTLAKSYPFCSHYKAKKHDPL